MKFTRILFSSSILSPLFLSLALPLGKNTIASPPSLSPAFQGGGNNVVILSGQVYDGKGGPLKSGKVYWAKNTAGSNGIVIPAGKTLTIQAGAILKFDPNQFRVSGTLKASFAVFTSIQDDQIGGDSSGNGKTIGKVGDWGGINLSLGAKAILTSVTMRFGGMGNGTPAISVPLGAQLTMNSCAISDFKYGGVINSDPKTLIQKCQFARCTFPILTDFFHLDRIIDCRAVSCSQSDAIQAKFLPQSATIIPPLTIGPRNTMGGTGVIGLLGQPVIPKNNYLTFLDGIILKMIRNSQFSIRGAQVFVKGGKAGVIFTTIDDDQHGGKLFKHLQSRKPQAGDWAGISLTSSPKVKTQLDARGLTLLYGGQKNGGIEVGHDCHVSLVGCRLLHNKSYGVYFEKRRNITSTNYALVSCHFENNRGPVFQLPCSALPNCSGNTVKGNRENFFHLYWWGYSRNLRIHPAMLPFGSGILGNSIDLYTGMQLKLEGGLFLFFEPGGTLDNREGTLVLQGEARRLVVLTSINDRPGKHPFPGSWKGVHLGRKARPSVLENAVIRYGDRGVWVQSPGHRLRNLAIQHSQFEGVRNEAANDIENTMILDGSSHGYLGTKPSHLRHCTILRNKGAGVFNSNANQSTTKVQNSIIWGNLGGNLKNLNLKAFSYSIGGFSGKNGNLNKDPKLDSQGSPLPSSPAIGAGSVQYLTSHRKSYFGRPRILDGLLNGNFAPDMGAIEYSVWDTKEEGQHRLGGTVKLWAIGKVPGSAIWFAGFGGPPILMPPYGFIQTGLVALTLLGASKIGPTPFVLPIPKDPRLKGLTLFFQGFLAASSLPGRANLSASYPVRIQ
ncbi:MAG TPA: right-handed parallel beta-helix repeat-containing protein [Planctomycetes bacterium]|nr:right-handed parallel beta-helix repeat-containing protein [Planctomycetota bacterium]